MRLMIDPNATPRAHHSPIPRWWKGDWVWCASLVARRLRDWKSINLRGVPFCLAQVTTPYYWFSGWNGFQNLQSFSNFTLRQNLSLKERRKPSSTHGMGTTVYHITPMTDTTLRLTFLGALIDIAQPLKATLPQMTYTSSIPNKTKYVDDTLLWLDTIQEASSKQSTGWTHVADMGLHSTMRSFVPLKKEVKFPGVEITKDTVRPCKKYIRSIADFPHTTQPDQHKI